MILEELIEEVQWQDDETGIICTGDVVQETQENVQIENVTVAEEIRLDRYENDELQSFPPTI